jgi:hypothetical protein
MRVANIGCARKSLEKEDAIDKCETFFAVQQVQILPEL